MTAEKIIQQIKKDTEKENIMGEKKKLDQSGLI